MKKENDVWMVIFIIVAILSFGFSVAGHTQIVSDDTCIVLSERYPEVASFGEGQYFWINHYPMPGYYAIGDSDYVETCDIPSIMSFQGIQKAGRVYAMLEDFGEIFFDTSDVTPYPALTLRWKEAEFENNTCLWNAIKSALSFEDTNNEFYHNLQGHIIVDIIRDMYANNFVVKDAEHMSVIDIQEALIAYRKAFETR